MIIADGESNTEYCIYKHLENICLDHDTWVSKYALQLIQHQTSKRKQQFFISFL